MIKIADTDGSGVVEFQEFMEMICDQVEVKIFPLAPSGAQGVTMSVCIVIPSATRCLENWILHHCLSDLSQKSGLS